MGLLGNLIWLVCGGLVSSLLWSVLGIFWCVTIVGIPLGVQCFKFARLSLAPFGASVFYGGGIGSAVLNVLWLVFTGVEMACAHAAAGLLLCLTIVGIPFGRQHFKLAKLALLPFGTQVV